MVILRGLRARVRARLRRDEEGFGLLELVVASTVMMTALTSMAYVATNAFGTIGMTRERATANGLLDEAIEQIRAIPYDTVWLGMRTSDLAGDPRVLGAGTSASPYRLASNNERIIHVSSNLTVAPLVPNSTPRTISGSVYTVRAYVSYHGDDPSTGAITATVYVDWFSGLQHPNSAFVRATTILYAPMSAAVGAPAPAWCTTGCTSPPPPVLPGGGGGGSGGGGGGGGGVSLPYYSADSSVKVGRTVISSGATTGLTIESPVVGNSVQILGTTSASGLATTQSATWPSAVPPSAWATLSGGSAANDWLPNPVAYERKQGSSPPPASNPVELGDSTLTMTVGAASTYDSVSTISANASGANDCRDLSDTRLGDGLPCTRTKADAGTTTATVDPTGLGLPALAGGMSVFQMGPTSVAVHTNQDRPSPSAICAGTANTGCIHTTATRSISYIGLGGLPAGSALKPVGFTHLIELTGYSDTVTAQAGIAAGAPTRASAGSLRIWNGLGYTTVPWSAAPATISSSSTFTSGVISVVMTANLKTGSGVGSTIAPTAMCTGGTGAATLACRENAYITQSSPLLGTFSYEVKLGGSTVLAFTIGVDFGDLMAQVAYKDP